MTFRTPRVALFFFTLAAFAALVLLSCGYPEPKETPPGCSEEEVSIAARSESDCATARFWVRMTFGMFRAKPVPGVDIEAAQGYLVTVHPESDGGAFFSEFWRRDIGGDTNPARKLIRLVSFNYGLPHEMAHAGDESACLWLSDGGADCHQRWEERGVCERIRATGAYEECGG